MPDFIIIGAMKCATSTLHEQLAAQPGIFMSEPKEPNFFSDDDVFARGIAWYSSLFAEATPAHLCGESSTHYTKLPTYPRTVERMRDMLAMETKLIYVMRNPIDRLISQYIHEWTQTVISCPINQAIDRHPELIEYGRYSAQLQPYFDAFGRRSVLPIFLDRLTAHPQAELERVCRFIGYAGTPGWDHALGRRNASAERLRKSRWRDALVNLPGAATLRRALVPRWVRDRIKGLWSMKERPDLTDANRARLEQIYDRDLGVIGNWLGIDLYCANFTQQTRDRVPAWCESTEPSIA